jgi:4-diphosphocytidyl-2-C-methyl-D-erythritol kinase
MRFRRVGPSLVVHTPAKLNLFLELLGKREDGYHELETLMVAVDLVDTLTFTEEDSNDIRLQCSGLGAGKRGSAPGSFASLGAAQASADGDGEGIPVGSDNLVVKAAQLLREHAGVERGVRISLVKRIPSAAGLAGGSSDAAATLMALNRFWNLGLGVLELQRLASHLGSDVAFFVDGTSAAVCHGRGEIIEPLDVPLGLHFVIVRPRTGLSTALVYKHAQVPANKKSVHPLAAALRAGRIGVAGRLLHNGLQPPAERLNPEVKRLQSLFSSLPVLGHQLSGSGTAYFGLCESARQARSLAGRLKGARVGRVWSAQGRP